MAAGSSLLLEGFEEDEAGGKGMQVDEGKKGEKQKRQSEEEEKEKSKARKSSSSAQKGGGEGTATQKGKKKGGGKGKDDKDNEASKKQMTEAFRENKALMSLIIAQVLNSAQTDRDLMGILYETWVIPIGSRIVELAKKQNLKYSDKVKVRGHGLGPPHLYTFGGVLAGLQELKKDSDHTEPLKTVIEAFVKKSAVEKGEVAKLCRASKVYDSSKYRVTMSFGTSPEAVQARQVVMAAMHSLGEEYEFKQGRPPPSFMERELGEWLQQMLE